MSTFKIGERVRVVRPFDDFKVGQIVTIRGFECDDDVAYVAVDGSGAVWDLNRFEKVEPEFVVGQQVSGDDYARLPVGTRVEDKYGPALVKVEDDAWRYANDPDAISYPSSDWSDARTIARLPDAAEPEDKDDLYVEPEPLKEGDWVQVWAQVMDGRPDGEGEIEIRPPRASDRYYSTYTLPDAIVRPDAGQVPPWVKRAPLTIDPNDEDGAVAELAHAIAEHCGVSVTFADLAKALAERSAAEGGAS